MKVRIVQDAICVCVRSVAVPFMNGDDIYH